MDIKKKNSWPRNSVMNYFDNFLELNIQNMPKNHRSLLLKIKPNKRPKIEPKPPKRTWLGLKPKVALPFTQYYFNWSYLPQFNFDVRTV